jgi:hypothetical protein
LLIQLHNLFYFCIKIDLLQSANLLTTNFAWLEPVLQKQFFSNSEGDGKSKTGFFQQQVLLYSKHVIDKWILGMCSFLNGKNYLLFSNTAVYSYFSNISFILRNMYYQLAI